VDAAAQLPPVENLWKFTSMGADLVLFSGGKTLCGPQPTGLIFGDPELIGYCRRFGAPAHGICRSSKVGREEMTGLYTAVRNYMELNREETRRRLESMVQNFIDAMNTTGAFRAERLSRGPVGQTYPRALGIIVADFAAEELAAAMRAGDPGVYIGVDRSFGNAVYLSPLNLSDREAETVTAVLRKNVLKLLQC
jgi:L-seryl-tRNA(Ser) seleniumtransferase